MEFWSGGRSPFEPSPFGPSKGWVGFALLKVVRPPSLKSFRRRQGFCGTGWRDKLAWQAIGTCAEVGTEDDDEDDDEHDREHPWLVRLFDSSP
jgi:hypothetical protein